MIMKRRLIFIILLIAIAPVFSSTALATISFIGGSLPAAGGGDTSAGAGRGSNMDINCNGTLATMTIPRPTGTVTGDAMIAMFIVRPQGTAITSPPGWTMMRRTRQVSGGNNTPPYGLDIITYFRVLKVGEIDTDYTWYISYNYPTCPPPDGPGGSPATQHTMAIGGILAFRGSFPIAPVYYSGDDVVNNGSSLTHFAPSILVDVPNTMTIAGIGFLSSELFANPTRTGGVESTTPAVGLNQWAGPSGTRVANGVGLSLQMSYFNQTSWGATGTVTAVAAANADNGVGHMVTITETMPPVDMAITKSANSGATEYYVTVISKTTCPPNPPGHPCTATQPAGTVVVSDDLPAQQTYIGYSGTNWNCANALQTVTCTYLPALPPGVTTPILTIRTANSATAVVCNTATANGAFGDGNTSDNTVSTCDPIGGAVVYAGKIYLDANQNNAWDSGETGIGQTAYVKVASRTGSTCTAPALLAVPTDSTTGNYSFSVAAGNYCLILDNNNLLSDITPSIPASYINTEQSTGINTTFVAAGTPQSNLNFGLYQPLYVRVIKTLIPAADTGKFNLSISGGSPTGGTNPANDVVDAGTTGFVAVTRGSDITVQETAGTATSLSNYTTTLNCATDTSFPLTLTSTLTGATRSGTFTAPASASAAYVTCTFTNRPATLTIKKVINSGTGGTFNFTATNPVIASTGIPVAVTNTPTTVVGLTNVLIPSLSTAITITEVDPAGISYALTAAGCIDNATSNPIASSINLGTRILTIAANTIPVGTDVVCTFTNQATTSDDHGDAPASYGDASNRVPTTVYLGTTAPDGDGITYITWQGQTTADGDDLSGGDEGIAQLLSGAPASFPAWSGASYALTLVCRGSATANAVNGWIDFNQNGTFDSNELVRGTCSSNNATAGTVTLTWSTFPNDLKTGPTYARFRFSGTASSAATGASANTGEVEDYRISITRPPQLTAAKIIVGRMVATDQFTVSINNGGPSATTAGVVETITTTEFNATAGTTYTFSEAGSGGASLANYYTSYSCTNSGTGGTAVSPGSGSSFTVTPVANDDITCTFVNTPKTLTLRKNIASRINSADQFQLNITGAGSTSATTSGAAAGLQPVTAISYAGAGTYTIGEAMAGGSFSMLSQYTTAVACTNAKTVANGGTDVTGVTSLGALPALTATDVVTCTITNTPKTLVLQKNIAARINSADQFKIDITGPPNSTATTTGSSTGLQTATIPSVTGAGTYTIAESMAAGSVSALSLYTTTVACTNAKTGGVNVSGVTTLGVLPALTATDGVICTITNTPIDYDYGDAPSGGTVVDTVARNYGTAAHVRPASPSVYLGTTAPDVDTAANLATWQAQTTALGDDGTGTGDEGIAQLLSGAPTVFPALSAGDTTYSLTLVCAGNGATVAGWIDFNKNGTFDAGERQSSTCASNAVTLSWSGLTALKSGITFARFRIATVAGEVANPVGVANNGEVEDYALTIRPGVKIIKSLVPTSDTGKFDLTVSGGNPSAPAGSSNPVSNVGHTGTTGFIAVDAAGTITLQEIGNAGAGTNLSNYTTTLSCTLGDGTTSVSLSASDVTNSATRSGTFTAPASNSAGTAAQVICTFTNTITAAGVAVSGFVYSDVNHNSSLDGGENGTGLTLHVKIAPSSGGTCNGPATQAVAANPATGAFTFATISSGDYCLILSDNSNLSDIIPTTTVGWIGTETASGIRQITVAAVALANQNFGLFHINTISGRVFKDDGTGGGTPNNGVQEGGETALAGVTVSLTNCGATTYSTATTDGSGNYALAITSSVSPGTFCIVETNLSGDISTGAQVGNTVGTYDRTTDKVQFALLADTSYTGINFGDVPTNRFLMDGSKTALAGATVSYPHTFIPGTGGTVTFGTSATASPFIAGWSEILYHDAACAGVLGTPPGPPLTGAVTVTAGVPFCLIVQEFVPANAPGGASNQATVTASFTYTNANPALTGSYTRQDLTIVSDVALQLTKEVRNVTQTGPWVSRNSAKQGEVLEYRITYINNGIQPISNLVVRDTTPAYTTFLSAACGALPANISACNVTTAPAPGSSGPVQWTFTGDLAPAIPGTVTYQVKVE
jgi:uncharacterized repeat protein (TIGR01451 family)